jgi:predicted nuclease with TOPRIM domain
MENSELQARVKELEYDCAELEKSNSELTDRVKKLANRMPAWPKGYRPQNRKFNNK